MLLPVDHFHQTWFIRFQKIVFASLKTDKLTNGRKSENINVQGDNTVTYQGQHDSECRIKSVVYLNHWLHATTVRIKLGLVSDNLCLVNDPGVVDALTHFWTSANIAGKRKVQM